MIFRQKILCINFFGLHGINTCIIHCFIAKKTFTQFSEILEYLFIYTKVSYINRLELIRNCFRFIRNLLQKNSHIIKIIVYAILPFISQEHDEIMKFAINCVFNISLMFNIIY